MPSPAHRPVLYVEDHPVNALLMAAILERRPELDLLIATTGEEALCMAAGLSPALLLLDLGLPDCHGSRLLSLLRALPGCERVPAVAVTADADFEIEHSGFCELWAKPLQIDLVLARVDALIGTSATTPPQLPPDLRAPPPSKSSPFSPPWL
ncbi:MAG: response regulator [Burkholderiales bacterium]|nr:response regulator [Burkholderiales bacterium]